MQGEIVQVWQEICWSRRGLTSVPMRAGEENAEYPSEVSPLRERDSYITDQAIVNGHIGAFFFLI